ncbi:hypothetical protein [Parasitella parasitica]|uniref:RNA-directed DNA polymerase n=1 Tax=Parasitella parasitica TaxID=35722 RepID=A0A0B7NI72_9FUNG|nr:hypothetical protein [Parasitella parasitica]
MPNTIKPVNFNKGDDADNWLKLYESTSKFNGWTEEQRLLYVGNCFPPEYQEWALNLATADNSSWDSFRTSFIQKFTKKVSPMQLIMQLSAFKMTKNESAIDYIDRFLRLKTRYERECQRRNSVAASRSASLASLMSHSRHPASTDSTPTTTPNMASQSPVHDQPTANEDIITITERGFIKYFIHGITYEFMRLTLRNHNFDKLDDLFETFKLMMNDNDDDFEFDLDVPTSSNRKQTNNAQETPKKSDEKYETLSKDVQTLATSVTTFIQMMKEQQNKQNNAPKPDYPPCDNCNKKGHATRLCNAPCKNCNGPHSIIKCNAQSSSKETNPSSHMLLELEETEDDLLAIGEKRSREDSNLTSSNKKVATDSNLPIKELRSRTLAVPPTPKPVQPKSVQPSAPKPISTPITTTTSSPLPLSHVDIESLLNDKVFLLSLSDIAAMSPKARAILKKNLTKSHSKKKENKVEANLIDESKSVKGTSAPRISGAINSLPCEIILDGGCTPCIISFELIKKLGLQDKLEMVDRKLIIGDGSSIPVKGTIKNLNINIGNAAIIYQDALCLDVGDKYTFIAGRKLMHELKITTDWESHTWSIKLSHQTVKLDVYYEKRTTSEPPSVPTILTTLEAVEDTSDSSDSSDDSSDDEEGFLLLMDDDAVNPLFDHDGFAIGDQVEAVSSPSHAIHLAFDDIHISEEANDRLGNLPSTVLDNPHLSSKQKKKAINLLVTFADVFGTGYKHLKKTDLVEFHVDTGNAKPVYQKPFSKFSYSELDTLKTELNEMVDHGVLVPHSYDKSAGNGWSFPCRYVTKKDGGKRLVTQFMKLNEVTVRDPWPIPSLKDTIEEIGSSSWLSNVDMLKGFNAIGVASDSVNKLTLSTPFGAFSYKALPFGVLNGPSAYARLMFLAVQPFMDRNKYPDPFLIHFFDDCSLFTNTFEDHLVKMEVILARFREVKLTLNSNKCHLFQHDIDLLGFNISKEGIKPLTEKVKKITEFPRLENQTGVRAFVNLCGFYRSHINCFTEIVEPLLKLLKKDILFSWTSDCEQAFNHLKAAIVDAATLSFPDRDKTFFLFCDASNVGIGSTLSQKNDKGEFVPVCFYSRKLQAAEVNYPTVEKELLCVVNSVAKFRKYLLDRHFVIYTDNAATAHLFSKQEPNSRLLRWCLGLQEFKFTIKHIPGKNNVVADVLSRFPPDDSLMDESGETVLENLYEYLMLESADFYEEPLMDLYCKIKAGVIPKDPKELKVLLSKYKVFKNHLYKKLWRNTFVKIPHINERQPILRNMHDGYGHFGVNATWKRLYSQYWWPNAYADVKEYVKTCHLCQIYSDSNPALPIGNVPADYLFQQYSLDFVGPFPATNRGNKFILVAVENFSNWPIAEATSVQDSTVVANFLYEKIFCQFGPFASILTDNGSPFSNDIVDKFLAIIRSKHTFTTPYRPQCNGKNEKLNGTLSRAIKKLTHNDPTNWDVHLHSVLYAYRTKVHEKTKLSPYQLLFGQNPLHTDSDPILELGNNLGFERYSKLVDRNNLSEVIHGFKPVVTTADFERHPKLLHPGDFLIKKRKKRINKLDTAFIPEIFTVVTAYNNNTYKVADSQGRVLQRAFNHNNVKQYFPRVPHE